MELVNTIAIKKIKRFLLNLKLHPAKEHASARITKLDKLIKKSFFPNKLLTVHKKKGYRGSRSQ
jgi:hypothetical protein